MQLTHYATMPAYQHTTMPPYHHITTMPRISSPTLPSASLADFCTYGLFLELGIVMRARWGIFTSGACRYPFFLVMCAEPGHGDLIDQSISCLLCVCMTARACSKLRGRRAALQSIQHIFKFLARFYALPIPTIRKSQREYLGSDTIYE